MQKIRLWAYIWYPALIVLWISLHFILSASVEPVVYETEFTAETNLSEFILNNNPLVKKEPLKMESIMQGFASQGQLMAWKYAYWCVWIWLLLGLFEYLSQFNSKWWWFKKVAKELYINYSFIIIMAYVVIFW